MRTGGGNDNGHSQIMSVHGMPRDQHSRDRRIESCSFSQGRCIKIPYRMNLFAVLELKDPELLIQTSQEMVTKSRIL